jgi:hypothetical protein
MKSEHEEYFWLLRRFLEHKICTQEFQARFFVRFRNEAIGMDESLFLLLDELFGALDCYTDDVELLAERPGFYLDINGLERECADICLRLEAWRTSQMDTMPFVPRHTKSGKRQG